MGEFRGQGLRDEYYRVLWDHVKMNEKLTEAINYELELDFESDKLNLLLDAENRLRKILADDFGVRS